MTTTMEEVGTVARCCRHLQRKVIAYGCSRNSNDKTTTTMHLSSFCHPLMTAYLRLLSQEPLRRLVFCWQVWSQDMRYHCQSYHRLSIRMVSRTSRRVFRRE